MGLKNLLSSVSFFKITSFVFVALCLFAGYGKVFAAPPIVNFTSPETGMNWSETRPIGNASYYWKKVASDSIGAHLFATDQCRLYISSDSGVSWSETQPISDDCYQWTTLASNSDGSRLIAAVQWGRVYVSSDYGSTWSEVQPRGDSIDTWNVSASDATGQHLLVGTTDDGDAPPYGRLYVSDDYGDTWSETQPAGDNTFFWSSVSSSADGSHLIATSNSRIYVSDNYGGAWTETQPAGDIDKPWSSTASDSTGTNLIAGVGLFQALGRLYISNNGGGVWTEVQPAGDTDLAWSAVAMDSAGMHLAVSVYGGRMYVSSDGGQTWTQAQPTGDNNQGWNTIASDAGGIHYFAGISDEGGPGFGRLYISDSPSVSGNSVAIAATSTDDDGVAGVQFKLDSNINIGAEDTIGSYAVSWDSTGVTDGSHTLFAVARDILGNYATATEPILVDNHAPSVSITAPEDNDLVGVIVTLMADAVDTVGVAGVQFKVDGESVGEDTDDSDGFSVDWDSSGLIEGNHTVTAIARDAAGNQTTSASITITLDHTGPNINITTPVADAVLSGTLVTVSADADDAAGVAGVQFKVDGVDIGSEDTSFPYQVAWDSTEVENGGHDLTAVARNTLGNQNTSAVITITTDNTPPTVSITTPSEGATVVGVSVSVTADASDKSDIWSEAQPNGNTDLNWISTASDSSGDNLAASDNGGLLYTSTNGGTSWTRRQPSVEGFSYYIVASDSDGSNLVAARKGFCCGATNGMYTSSDGGVNWTERTVTGGSQPYWTAIASDSDGSNLVVVVSGGRVYSSSDGGANWAEKQPAGNSNKSWVSVASDNDGSTIFVATLSNLYVSSDSGTTWTDRTPPTSLSARWSSVASDSDGSNLIAVSDGCCGTDGGVWISVDTGVTWTRRDPVGVDKPWAAVASDDTGTNLVAAQADTGASTGRMFVSSDGGMTWSETQPAGDFKEYWSTVAMDGDGTTIIAGRINSGRLYVRQNLGQLESVQFKLDGANLGSEDTSSPYEITWDTTNTANGTHTLRAVARDTGGNYSTSTAINVTVDNIVDTTTNSAHHTSSGGSRSVSIVSQPSSQNIPIHNLTVPQLTALLQSLQAKLAVILASGGVIPVTTRPVLTRNLTLGDTGQDVKALQKYLNTHGFPVAEFGPGSPGKETTIFGPATQAALAYFQQKHGLPGTGYFGPRTRAIVGH